MEKFFASQGIAICHDDIFLPISLCNENDALS